jgi:hypothetical protein
LRSTIRGSGGHGSANEVRRRHSSPTLLTLADPEGVLKSRDVPPTLPQDLAVVTSVSPPSRPRRGWLTGTKV